MTNTRQGSKVKRSKIDQRKNTRTKRAKKYSYETTLKPKKINIYIKFRKQTNTNKISCTCIN